MGIPLVPVHEYPQDAKVIFLPTQAATDNDIISRIENSLSKGSTIIFTTGFLANAVNGEKLAELAGVKYPLKITPIRVTNIFEGGKSIPVEYGLDLASHVAITCGKSLLSATAGSIDIPLLITSNKEGVKVNTLNTYTFSQSDFDKVGEVLLCPKPLGLLELPQKWTNKIREAFISDLNIKFDAPGRITIQPLGTSGWMFHNYNKTKEKITFIDDNISDLVVVNGFTGEMLETDYNKLQLELEPRSRIWVKTEQ
jgi:hypothetical protein